MKVIIVDKKLSSGVKIESDDKSIIGIMALDKDHTTIKKFANKYFVYFYKMVKSDFTIVSECKI